MAFTFATQDLIMKRIACILFAFISVSTASAQLKTKKDWSKVKIEKAGDHILIQLSSDHWSGAPDSINNRMKGLSRGLNFYVMMNKPFKTDPRWSVAGGVGVSTSSMFFTKTNIGLTNINANTLAFTDVSNSNHFKKYKLATTFVEIPIELRYTFDPLNEDKSWKIAVGVKVGTMLNVHTKGKTLQSSTGTVINNYTEKESSKQFFNTTRLAATARVGMGHWSVFGAYSITSLLKDAAGASIKPIQIGITLSGL